MIPLVLMAGFLGAGKTRFLTTLIPQLLERGVRFIQLWTGAGQPWDNHDEILDHKKLGGQKSTV